MGKTSTINCTLFYSNGYILCVMLDSYCAALGKTYDPSDGYTPMDVPYILELMERYPENHVWLLAHGFEPDKETEAFRRVVADPRVKGLFMGHSHDHRLIPLGREWGNKTIAQTGNFSYTMSGAHTGGFWGFRDLVITGETAVSRYIMTANDVILEEGPVHFDRRITEIQEYTL